MKKFIDIFLILFLLLFFPYVIFKVFFLDKVYFLCPIEYKKEIIIRNDRRGKGHFGAPRNGNLKHKGVDFKADINAVVKAVRYARVIETGYHKGLGNYVEIDHGNKLRTIYGHLNKIFVKQGQLIRQSQIIGLVGKTGNAKHPKISAHLHFEVRVDGKPVDPMEFIK